MDFQEIIHTFAPTPNRQLVAAAIAEIVHENPDIKLMGAFAEDCRVLWHAMGII
ncbi:hypothetical protein ANAPRD1_01130 [Anaplasma phagocytophilum]|uniref:hypothetical protein n=1 Tax=Anaplasma phagocytophilum TaxID=948 RepID=UPI0007E0D189|nr:hypothetical protein [Anaplasma phagocytophilum]SCV66551.1 hypothetical protein ANAPRD1_01130 [Anaplasma phagocytophilum]